jgi:hypothetical protein
MDAAIALANVAKIVSPEPRSSVHDLAQKQALAAAALLKADPRSTNNR